MSLSPFFGNLLEKISDSVPSSNQLINCLAYIAYYQKITINYKNINNIDSLNIENISSYENHLGLHIKSVSMPTKDEMTKIFHPILVQLNKSNEFRIILPGIFFRNKIYNPATKSLEKLSIDMLDNNLHKSWECYSNNFCLPLNLTQVLVVIFRFFKRDIIISLILSLLVSGAALFVSYLAGFIFSHIYDFHSGYVIVYIPFLFFILASVLMGYIADLYFKTLNIKFLASAIPSVWHHVLHLPLKVINQFRSGELVQRITDYESSLSVIVTALFQVFLGLLSMLFLMGYMAFCSGALACLYFFIYAILIIIKIWIFPKNAKYVNEYLRKLGKNIAFLNEAFMQIDKIRSAHIEHTIFKKWFHNLINAKIEAEKSVTIEMLMWILDTLAPFSLLIFFYSYLYFNPPTNNTYYLLQFMICAGQLSVCFEKFSLDTLTLVHLLPALKRLSPIIDQNIEKSVLSQNPNVLSGRINLLNVSLHDSYTGSFILENISMNVSPGSFVAIVGQSGAGKSTVFKLLLGFEPLYSGVISIDNEDINNMDKSLMRKQFGVVLQNTNIFPGTIFSNIAANTKITLDDAWKLAKYVGLEEEIHAMPMKMYTHISDNAGESISGGQRQKILIARALSTRPKILFLDEATSALDNASQSLIFANLKSLNITRFVIAHRYSTIVDADLIYVLDKGKMIDYGSYQELLKRGRLE